MNWKAIEFWPFFEIDRILVVFELKTTTLFEFRLCSGKSSEMMSVFVTLTTTELHSLRSNDESKSIRSKLAYQHNESMSPKQAPYTFATFTVETYSGGIEELNTWLNVTQTHAIQTSTTCCGYDKTRPLSFYSSNFIWVYRLGFFYFSAKSCSTPLFNHCPLTKRWKSIFLYGIFLLCCLFC